MYKLHDFFYSVSKPWKVSDCSTPVFRAEALSKEKLEGTILKAEHKLPICEAVPPHAAPEWE